MTPVIILAGGKSSRMGTDKTRLPFGGETLLERAFRRFSMVFGNVIISANGDVGIPDAHVVNDIHPGLGPISGLHAALCEYEAVFLVAADMPFADPEVAQLIIEAGQDFPACAGTSGGRSEPLFAYYTKAVIPEIERAVETCDYSLHRLLERVGARLFAVNPDTLVNINRPEDYEKLKSCIELDKF